MNIRDVWDHIQGRSNQYELIDELEAKGEITPLMAEEVRGALDDQVNEACKQIRAGKYY